MAIVLMGTPVEAANLKVGDIAPSYVGRDTSGDKIYLSEHRGKVIVLSFWATWCAPCIKELPILEGIQMQVSTDKLMVIAVNYKQGRKAFRKIERILAEATITLSFDKGNSVSGTYRVKAIPHTLVIDKQGKIAHIHRGYSADMEETLAKELNELLASKYTPPETPAN